MAPPTSSSDSRDIPRWPPRPPPAPINEFARELVQATGTQASPKQTSTEHGADLKQKNNQEESCPRVRSFTSVTGTTIASMRPPAPPLLPNPNPASTIPMDQSWRAPFKPVHRGFTPARPHGRRLRTNYPTLGTQGTSSQFLCTVISLHITSDTDPHRSDSTPTCASQHSTWHPESLPATPTQTDTLQPKIGSSRV